MNSVIQESIFFAVQDFEDETGIPVYYPGSSFDAPDQGAWLELIFLPNSNLGGGISANTSEVSQGIFRLNVCNRANTGAVDLDILAEQVIAAFPYERLITNRVIVSGWPQASEIGVDDGVMRVAVTIPYIGSVIESITTFSPSGLYMVSV